MNTAPVDEDIALAAAEWFFRLREHDASADDRAACAAWRATDPRHEQAWQKAQRIGQSLATLPPDVAFATLDHRKRGRRRSAIKTLAVLICAPSAGWLAWHGAPAREWLAEQRTAAGEQRRLTLADGTRLHLNTATALDVAFDADQRLLRLYRGELLIDTAPDPQAGAGLPARPFLVETGHGHVRPLGTRFIVRREDGHSRVTVYAGRVALHPAGAPHRDLLLGAGQQARFSADATSQPTDADPHGADWSQGLLVARNQRLADFAAELARYRPGLLRCDPTVADLRITGAFQLRDTNAILASLPEVLPVRVVYRTRYWVTLAGSPPTAAAHAAAAPLRPATGGD